MADTPPQTYCYLMTALPTRSDRSESTVWCSAIVGVAYRRVATPRRQTKAPRNGFHATRRMISPAVISRDARDAE